MDAELQEQLGDSVEAVAELGAKLVGLAAVVLESALGKKAAIVDPLFSRTVPEEIVDEFGVLPHIGLELRFSLSESEAYLMALLLTIDDAKVLLASDISTGDEIALKAAERSASEVADLIGLMLFTDSPLVGGIKVSEVRFDGIAETIGMVADVAQGSPLARLEFDVEDSEDSSHARLTAIVPLTMLQRLASALAAPAQEAEPAASEEPASGLGGSDADAIDAILREHAGDFDGGGSSRPRGIGEAQVDVHSARFQPFDQPSPGSSSDNGLDLIQDVSLRISVELGRTVMTVHDVLGLGPGSVVELDKLAGEPVDILVNDRIVARGEVVVVDENFGVRVTEIVSSARKPLPIG